MRRGWKDSQCPLCRVRQDAAMQGAPKRSPVGRADPGAPQQRCVNRKEGRIRNRLTCRGRRPDGPQHMGTASFTYGEFANRPL